MYQVVMPGSVWHHVILLDAGEHTCPQGLFTICSSHGYLDELDECASIRHTRVSIGYCVRRLIDILINIFDLI